MDLREEGLPVYNVFSNEGKHISFTFLKKVMDDTCTWP